MTVDNRGKIVLTKRQVHHALGLGEDVVVVGLDVGRDPDYLLVQTRSPRWAHEVHPGEHPDDTEMDIVKLADAQ